MGPLKFAPMLIGGAALFAAAALIPAKARADAPDSGAAMMRDIEKQLSFGVRAPGHPGHERTLAFIADEMTKSGAALEKQSWRENVAGRETTLINLVARLNPETQPRILLGTHYDSLVRAYRDPRRPQAPMPGANNSASGVALLLDLARTLKASKSELGVDFVFFDGEEGPLALGAGDPQWRALGSPVFARKASDFYPAVLPKLAIVFDMVCYRDLRLRTELLSRAAAPAETAQFWRIGRQVAPRIFDARPGRKAISDDHNALIAAGIPSFLVIGFDYDPWFNTTQDTLDKCAPQSLAAVKRTSLLFLATQ